jgi:hypothetical protein
VDLEERAGRRAQRVRDAGGDRDEGAWPESLDALVPHVTDADHERPGEDRDPLVRRVRVRLERERPRRARQDHVGSAVDLRLAREHRGLQPRPDLVPRDFRG